MVGTRLQGGCALLLALVLLAVPVQAANGAPPPREIDRRLLTDEDGLLGYGACSQGQCAPGQDPGALDLLALDLRETSSANGSGLLAFRFLVESPTPKAQGRSVELSFTAHGEARTLSFEGDGSSYSSKDFTRVAGPTILGDGTTQAIDAWLDEAAAGLATGDSLEGITVTSNVGGKAADVMPGGWYDDGVLVPHLPDEAGEAADTLEAPAPGNTTLLGAARLLLLRPYDNVQQGLPFTIDVRIGNPLSTLGQNVTVTARLDGPGRFDDINGTSLVKAGEDVEALTTVRSLDRDANLTLTFTSDLGAYVTLVVPVRHPFQESPAPAWLAPTALALAAMAVRRKGAAAANH